jgi:hypothetical protein
VKRLDVLMCNGLDGPYYVMTEDDEGDLVWWDEAANEIDRLTPTPSDRTALSTAAFELKERRANYAAMLKGFEHAGADPFVIESYRDSVKACDAAIECVERLAKGGDR